MERTITDEHRPGAEQAQHPVYIPSKEKLDVPISGLRAYVCLKHRSTSVAMNNQSGIYAQNSKWRSPFGLHGKAFSVYRLVNVRSVCKGARAVQGIGLRTCLAPALFALFYVVNSAVKICFSFADGLRIKNMWHKAPGCSVNASSAGTLQTTRRGFNGQFQWTNVFVLMG
ncbi:hypothetical protein CUZ56_00613 [Saezia sanguinis]|uniref:Uncharacterized protein n=1 Tax=Saezia sanguinis TaxID=1965230 RepID=A0A433SHC7_9BURK|nr:hypothetical protein [Saezia sanguinis]RUS68128.1 hypothetical protein CUZ56_00613 [Saezia sanguinis]